MKRYQDVSVQDYSRSQENIAEGDAVTDKCVERERGLTLIRGRNMLPTTQAGSNRHPSRRRRELRSGRGLMVLRGGEWLVEWQALHVGRGACAVKAPCRSMRKTYSTACSAQVHPYAPRQRAKHRPRRARKYLEVCSGRNGFGTVLRPRTEARWGPEALYRDSMRNTKSSIYKNCCEQLVAGLHQTHHFLL
jgi:hypothetical protein